MNIKELLENRHRRTLNWIEPRKGLSADGNELTEHVTVLATVHQCISMQRAAYRGVGLKTDDEELLKDFIEIHGIE